jgi:hypothetical protein
VVTSVRTWVEAVQAPRHDGALTPLDGAVGVALLSRSTMNSRPVGPPPMILFITMEDVVFGIGARDRRRADHQVGLHRVRTADERDLRGAGRRRLRHGRLRRAALLPGAELASTSLRASASEMSPLMPAPRDPARSASDGTPPARHA